MRYILLILSLSIFAFVGVADAGYTNLAGKVLAASPVKVEGANVTFDCGAGRSRTLPLKAFPVSEQARIQDATDRREGRAPTRTMPSELKALAAEIASQRMRAEARAKAGRMTPVALAEYCENLAGSWAHAVEGTNLDETDKAYWKGACP